MNPSIDTAAALSAVDELLESLTALRENLQILQAIDSTLAGYRGIEAIDSTRESIADEIARHPAFRVVTAQEAECDCDDCTFLRRNGICAEDFYRG